jgi:hypothetical protein
MEQVLHGNMRGFDAMVKLLLSLLSEAGRCREEVEGLEPGEVKSPLCSSKVRDFRGN